MALQQHYSNGKSQQGVLLVASPHLRGTPYDRSVVLLVEYGTRGARGLVLSDALRESIRQIQEPPATKSRLSEPAQIELGVINWEPGALDQELDHGVWMATTASEAERYQGHADLWIQLVRGIGRSVLQESLDIHSFPSDPTCN